MELIHAHLLRLGYNGQAQNIELVTEACSEGPPNLIFVEIVTWLSSQLVAFCELESHVSPVVDLEDLGAKALGFLVEVSSLLKELCCPIKSLTTGNIDGRLSHPDDKRLLILYLCTESQAAKILAHKKPKKKEAPLQIELAESKTAKELREMLMSLRFPKPPDTITPQQLFSEVEKKIRLVSQPLTPKEMIGELLFTGCLTEKQWFQLEHLYKEMHQEYKTRRNLLLTRLDVTVKSFLWADRLKNKSEELLNIYSNKKMGLMVEPSVKISHVLAAKADLAVIEKTSSASVRKNTKSRINEVKIGAVPDRGGRPAEQQPPPPEVPSWQKSDSYSRGGMKQSAPPPSSNYRSSRPGQNQNDENSNPRYQNEGYHHKGDGRDFHNKGDSREFHNKSDNRGGSSFRGGRINDFNAPVYQAVEYCGQPHNPQFGFGGYVAAGDNFQQYGMNEGMNQYLPRATRGSGPRQRGGFSDRGSSAPRGRSRGRGRW